MKMQWSLVSVQKVRATTQDQSNANTESDVPVHRTWRHQNPLQQKMQRGRTELPPHSKKRHTLASSSMRAVNHTFLTHGLTCTPSQTHTVLTLGVTYRVFCDLSY